MNMMASYANRASHITARSNPKDKTVNILTYLGSDYAHIPLLGRLYV